ncbi:MAG TPA: enoyl-CoA hydratase/isomerase family protein [Dehalococcoidia bacterium]|nr:enoyl-CoA hydratase/isomerase family protein [Dehalococcoidia bacterium]
MNTEEFDELIIDEQDGIALVKLNRPDKLNSWGGHMNEQLSRYLLSLNQGSYDVRAIVLTGEGRAFSAGGDVRGFPAANPGAERPPWRPSHPHLQVVNTMRHCDVPIIGAINGYAVGAGWSTALACDIRIAADDATFQVSQTKRGIVADAGLSYFLPRVVGTQRALELMFTGRRVTADEALEMGVVLEVVPAAQLLDRAMEVAAAVAAGPPLSSAAHKRLVYMLEDDDLTRVQDLTSMIVGKLFLTEDGAEGVRSFVERREPEFTGR